MIEITDLLNYNINTTNGLTTSITDSNNTSTNYTYDNKFRTTNITKDNQSVSYEYTNNNLSKITHGTKNYIFNYDEFNNTLGKNNIIEYVKIASVFFNFFTNII